MLEKNIQAFSITWEVSEKKYETSLGVPPHYKRYMGFKMSYIPAYRATGNLIFIMIGE